MRSEQPFRADIQGLRAIAVLPVVAFHASARLAPGGFFGVDIFFVISGYLITHILLREMEAGTYSLAGFYARRIKRLFPALYLMLAATVLIGILLLPPSDLAELAFTTKATVLFFSNFRLMHLSGYFDGAAELKPLLHTWSLAVEEQFYVVFPVFLFILVRYARKSLGAVLWLCAILSFGTAAWLLRHDPTGAFFLPQARAWELLIGALIATGAVPRVRSRRLLDALSMLGLVLIAIGLFGFDDQSAAVWPAAFVACLGAALLIYTGEDGHATLAGRLLSVQPLVLIGTISYSLYLWHWPLLVYARFATLGEMPAAAVIAAVVASFILAWLSWRYVEEPVRKRRFGQKRVLAAGAVIIVGAYALVMPIASTQGLPSRFSPETLRLFASYQDSSPFTARCNTGTAVIPYDRNCVLGDPQAVPHIAVWGDSFGISFAAVLGERLAARHASVMEVTASACPPSIDHDVTGVAEAALQPVYCNRRTIHTFERLKADARITRVILISRYDYDLNREKLLDGFIKAAEGLAAAGKRITIVYPVPAQGFNVPKALGMLAARNGDYRRYGTRLDDYLRQSAWARTKLDALAARINADRIMPAARLCQDGLCRAYLDGIGSLYTDNVHLSMSGLRYLLADGAADGD